MSEVVSVPTSLNERLFTSVFSSDTEGIWEMLDTDVFETNDNRVVRAWKW